jgi:hypothetical protein
MRLLSTASSGANAARNRKRHAIWGDGRPLAVRRCEGPDQRLSRRGDGPAGAAGGRGGDHGGPKIQRDLRRPALSDQDISPGISRRSRRKAQIASGTAPRALRQLRRAHVRQARKPAPHRSPLRPRPLAGHPHRCSDDISPLAPGFGRAPQPLPK